MGAPGSVSPWLPASAKESTRVGGCAIDASAFLSEFPALAPRACNQIKKAAAVCVGCGLYARGHRQGVGAGLLKRPVAVLSSSFGQTQPRARTRILQNPASSGSAQLVSSQRYAIPRQTTGQGLVCYRHTSRRAAAKPRKLRAPSGVARARVPCSCCKRCIERFSYRRAARPRGLAAVGPTQREHAAIQPWSSTSSA